MKIIKIPSCMFDYGKQCPYLAFRGDEAWCINDGVGFIQDTQTMPDLCPLDDYKE